MGTSTRFVIEASTGRALTRSYKVASKRPLLCMATHGCCCRQWQSLEEDWAQPESRSHTCARNRWFIVVHYSYSPSLPIAYDIQQEDHKIPKPSCCHESTI